MFFLYSARSPHRTAKPSRGCLSLAHPRALPAVVVSDRRSPSAMYEFPFGCWGCGNTRRRAQCPRSPEDLARAVLAFVLFGNKGRMKLATTPPAPWPNRKAPVSTRNLADRHGARGGGCCLETREFNEADLQHKGLVSAKLSPFATGRRRPCKVLSSLRNHSPNRQRCSDWCGVRPKSGVFYWVGRADWSGLD